MEKCNAHLSRINYLPDLFVLFLLSTVATSFPTKGTGSIADVMRNDTKLCDSIKVLYESKYTKNCTTLLYPEQPWDGQENTLNKYLCLGVYDTAYKICQYFDLSQAPLKDVEVFNSYVEKFSPNENTERYCEDNLQGFASYNNKIAYWEPLVDRLGKPQICQRTCFDFNFIFRPLCAVFAWIKSIEDEMKKSSAPVTNDHQNPAALDVPQEPADPQPVDVKPAPKLKEEKKPEVKESSKEKLHENVFNNVLNEHIQPNTEKSDPEKLNKPETQKVLNITSPKIVDHSPREKSKESISNVKDEPNVEAPKASSNVPSKENVNMKEVKENNAEDIDKKPEVEDTKTSTISENTQDHYSSNMDEDLEGDNIDDPENTQIEPGNQNESPQEPIGQKNQRPKIEAEGDSPHFFTYFTMTTIACIICYIGYHNKQKILAIVLEGRKSKNSRGRRRPSTASYRKLDCTLEEAVTSQCNANVTHVIY